MEYQPLIPTNLLGFVIDFVKIGLKALEADKTKAAASLAGLPVCFEYSEIAGQIFAKPNIKATEAYLQHLRFVWDV